MLGRELAVLEGLEVAFQLALDATDLSACRREWLLELRPRGLGRIRRGGECLLDDVAVAVELRELGEHGCFESLLGNALTVALSGAVLVAGRAVVVGVPAAATVRAGPDVGATAVVAADESGE